MVLGRRSEMQCSAIKKSRILDMNLDKEATVDQENLRSTKILINIGKLGDRRLATDQKIQKKQGTALKASNNSNKNVVYFNKRNGKNSSFSGLMSPAKSRNLCQILASKSLGHSTMPSISKFIIILAIYNILAFLIEVLITKI
ncbi:unnamed protein product [Moneuplotes crassus]|uniref:Uncharacterized protein n=1 Tax=Euplotes crassus TaxID=5936 RepID=A0AAD1U6K4_EUPCR|nr:unnamed protein product [Moneuplotes crassus]